MKKFEFIFINKLENIKLKKILNKVSINNGIIMVKFVLWVFK